MSVGDTRVYTYMWTVHDKLSCTRLQNYTIGASLKYVSVSLSVSVPWNPAIIFFCCCVCVQAASPACTELETIVLDWLGAYCEKLSMNCPDVSLKSIKKSFVPRCLFQYMWYVFSVFLSFCVDCHLSILSIVYLGLKLGVKERLSYGCLHVRWLRFTLHIN